MEYSYFCTSDNNSNHSLITYNHFLNLERFINVLEELEPHVISDLENLIPFYRSAYDTAIQRYGNGLDRCIKFPNWEEVKDSDLPEFIILKRKIKDWANKYRLIGSKNPAFFLIIALYTVGDYYEVTQMEKNPELLFVDEDFKLSLKNCLDDFVDDSDPILEKYDYENNNKSLPMNRLFPFVFSPTFDEMLFCKAYKEEIEDYIRGEEEKQEVLKKLSHLEVEGFLSKYKELERDYYFQGILNQELAKTLLLKNKIEREHAYLYDTQWEGYGWDGRNETWGDFEKNLKQMFSLLMKKYKKKVENFLESNNYKKGTIKRDEKQHYSWLVMYQVQLKRVEDIGRLHGKDAPAIYAAIRKTAADVGIKLREPDTRGRRN